MGEPERKPERAAKAVLIPSAVIAAAFLGLCGVPIALEKYDSYKNDQRAAAMRAHAEYRAKTFGEEIPSGSRTVIVAPPSPDTAHTLATCEQVTVGMFQRDEDRDGIYEYARECLSEVAAADARRYCATIRSSGALRFCNSGKACARAHGAMTSACSDVR